MLWSWKKKETGPRKRLLESGTRCVSRGIQAPCCIPQPKIGKGGCHHGHLTTAMDPPAMPFLGAGRGKAMEGAAASVLCLHLHSTGELAGCGRESKDIREALAPTGHSHWIVPELGGEISAESAGEDAHSAVAVGFPPLHSHFRLFAALGFGSPRDISQARSLQFSFSYRAFWGNQIPRKAGLFQTPGGITSE